MASRPAGGAAVAVDRAPPTPLALLVVVMVMVIAPLIALSQFIAYWRVDVVDDQMFGYFGWRIAHGARVYLDVWDNKPPGIYWVNALGMLLGRDSYLGVIAMCALALVVAHAAFFIIAASLFYRGAAALATILLSFYLTHGFYTGGTNRTETFLVACELVAVAFYVRGWARDRWWKWYSAGLCCGLAFLFKQVGLAAWACLNLHTLILIIARELPLRVGLKRGLLLLGGLGTTTLAAAAYLASQGALREAWFATFGFNQAYFATGTSRFPYNLVNWYLLRHHVHPILLLPLLMAAAAAVHAFLWWLRPQYRPPEIEGPLRLLRPVCPRYFLLFTLWFLVAFYGALLSPHAFRHYLVPTIPPLLLIAGYLINVLQAETTLLRRFQQRGSVLVAYVVMAYFASEAVRLQFTELSKVLVFRFEQQQRASWEAVGDVVAGMCSPQDTIQCLGYMPGVYLRARRINASRFTTTEKIGQVGQYADFVGRELEDRLRSHPPVLLVMSAGDYYRLQGLDPKDPSPLLTGLAGWLGQNYQLVEDMSRYYQVESGRPRYDSVYIFKRLDRIDPDRDPNLRSHLQAIKPSG